MGRYSEKYSETLRRAIGSALVDPEPLTGKLRTVPQVRRLLEAGELRYEGELVEPPADPIPTSTFYNLKTREQQRRKGEILSPLAQQALENPEAVRERIIQRAVSIWDYEQERLEDQRSKGRVDNGLFSRQIKNAPVITAMLKAMSNQQKPPRNHGREAEPAQEPEKPDELSSLIKAHEQGRRGVAA